MILGSDVSEFCVQGVMLLTTILNKNYFLKPRQHGPSVNGQYNMFFFHPWDFFSNHLLLWLLMEPLLR